MIGLIGRLRELAWHPTEAPPTEDIEIKFVGKFPSCRVSLFSCLCGGAFGRERSRV